MNYKTPGVYVKEINSLPPSVAGVSTAVPIFIGFTQYVHPNPIRIESMSEFVSWFGAGYAPNFEANVSANVVVDVTPDRRFYLYDSLYLYFLNGGGPCYIQSLGDFSVIPSTLTGSSNPITKAIDDLGKIDEVTLVCIPDLHAMYKNGGNLTNMLSDVNFATFANALMTKCSELQDKFALLDYHNMSTGASDMRSRIINDKPIRRYGALYYPWLKNSDNYNLKFDELTVNGYSSTLSQNIQNLISDISLYETQFGGRDLTALSQSYIDNKGTFLSNSTGKKVNLTTVISSLTQLIRNLQDLETLANSTINALLIAELNLLHTNPIFIQEVQKLIRLVNILSTQTASDPNSPSSYLGAIPASNNIDNQIKHWFNYDGANLDLSTIEVDSSIISDTIVDTVDSSGNTTTKTRDEIFQEIDTGTYLNYELLFSYINGVVQNLIHRKKIAEDNLFNNDPVYAELQAKVVEQMKTIPAQGAVMGLYCKNDRTRGIWKSPANLSLTGIERPVVELSNDEQDNLNIDVDNGKSINAIRTFTGKGVLVWGARTLDGSDGEWKYIAVRRFYNFVEESIKKSLETFVFEPNTPHTWVKIQAMITSFLVQYWQAGALVGTKMEDAFFVNIGQDITTTEAEILQGIINVEVGMAVARPAEFIILEFSHKTQS